MAKEIKHCDKLGVDLNPGDYIVAPYATRQLVIAQIVKLNPKMLTIKQLGKRYTSNTYPHETVKIAPEMLTMYLLKNAK
jgi:hypothetical protein